MSSSRATDRPQPDLRERRRRELVRGIAAAAVELFERQGFGSTTIDDIAAEAGISRTTFFRYCATKEAAVLVDDAGLEAELIAVAKEAPKRDPLAHLEQAWADMAAVFDADAEGRDRFLLVRRLMREQPALLAAGLERDARLAAHLADALEAGAGLSSLDAAAVAESFAVGIRLTFDEWVRRVDDAPTPSTPPLTSIYRDVRSALARARGGAAS
ncbi:TetR/AcrR family transcriptional regulator [Microbacterium sp. SLBN-154]|uniref:TetR/AcrR family transcriptional regulator n=1 Tax=Microbacterium sp. SLBN-154 TaxID=2768458 RepID=UPI00114F1C3B|nr:TetR/AcrR family transcriptional regulator [Microbacterium sp. SLBN-154]